MAKIYDQQTDFQQGAPLTGDSGENTSAAIKPVAGGEYLWDGPLNRSPENLRKRTEALRAAVDDLRYYADYDRGLTLSAPGATFSFVADAPPAPPDQYKLIFATGTTLEILPVLSPGRVSGGRHRGARMFTEVSGVWQPYAGTPGTDDISFVVDSNITGLRGYADINNLVTDLGVSLGANRLRITLVDDPAQPGGGATYSVAVTGTPATKITITYGSLTSPTTLTQLINKINTDTSSLTGSLGLSHLIVAATTSPGTASPPVVTDAVFQGGYDAEGFTVTGAALTAFFVDPANYLVDGEGLALGFVSGPVTTGNIGPFLGRRQSLFDMPNNRLGSNVDNTGNSLTLKLFNTGRHPELIPGAVPIGKMVGTKFVFIDGTVTGGSPVILGGSVAPLVNYEGSPSGLIPPGTLEVALDALDTNLAATTPTSGATYIGYGGSPNAWIPAGTLEAALDTVDTALAATGPTSGATHIGYKGSPHNWIPAGTLEDALDTVDTALASTTTSSEGGLLVGFHGVNAWADTTTLTAATVQTAIEEIVSDLASQTSGADGAGRIGAYQIAGTSSDGNGNLDLGTSNLSAHVANLLSATGSGRTSPGGVNYRVSEYGHRMHGLEPIEKIFSEAGVLGGGGQLIRAVLNPAYQSLGIRRNKEEQASIYLEPLTYAQDASDGLDLIEGEQVEVSGAASVKLVSPPAGKGTKIANRTAVSESVIVGRTPHCVISLSGLPSLNGYYFATSISDAVITLKKMDGTTPDLTTLVLEKGAITFYRSRIIGSNSLGSRTRSTLLWDSNAGADVEYHGGGYVAKGYSATAELEHTATVVRAQWGLTTRVVVNSGAAAIVSTVLAGIATITGLSGMDTDSENNDITFTDGIPANNGTFKIFGYISPTSVTVLNPSAAVSLVSLKWLEKAPAVRDTNNTLIQSDARLLKGRETQTAVDATRGHHHGGAYSIIVAPELVYGSSYISWHGAGASIQLSDAPAYLSSTSALSFVPVLYSVSGFFLEINTTLWTRDDIALGSPYHLKIETSPGVVDNPANSRTVVELSGYTALPLGSSSTYIDTRLMFVPTNSLGQAVFLVSISTNVSLLPSRLQVRPSSVVAYRT